MDAFVAATKLRSGVKHVRLPAIKTAHAHASVSDVAHARLLDTGHTELSQLICEHDSGILRLRGQLPNYYLKQLAQELLRDLEGVDQIVNAVEVI